MSINDGLASATGQATSPEQQPTTCYDCQKSDRRHDDQYARRLCPGFALLKGQRLSGGCACPEQVNWNKCFRSGHGALAFAKLSHVFTCVLQKTCSARNVIGVINEILESDKEWSIAACTRRTCICGFIPSDIGRFLQRTFPNSVNSEFIDLVALHRVHRNDLASKYESGFLKFCQWRAWGRERTGVGLARE